MDKDVYPDVNASVRLVREMTDFFQGFLFVNRVLVFGSFAVGSWDRWSDIDMLIVTDSSSSQYWQLFDALQQHKPILHHHTFTPYVEPAGGNVLGIVFQDESVFHNLDLNFMSLREFLVPSNLERFGYTKELYRAKDRIWINQDSTSYPAVDVNLDERRIGIGIHWTKKAIKKRLRGADDVDSLTTASARLKEIMQGFPKDIPMPGGNICRLARLYIKIVDQVLGQENHDKFPS